MPNPGDPLNFLRQKSCPPVGRRAQKRRAQLWRSSEIKTELMRPSEMSSARFRQIASRLISLRRSEFDDCLFAVDLEANQQRK